MTDREVVITYLDDLRLFADVTVHPAVCPDNWDVYSSLCDYIDQIKTEVEILLKEQEASWISVPHKKARICSRCYADEPYKFADEDADVYNYCPNCGARMINRR